MSNSSFTNYILPSSFSLRLFMYSDIQFRLPSLSALYKFPTFILDYLPFSSSSSWTTDICSSLPDLTVIFQDMVFSHSISLPERFYTASLNDKILPSISIKLFFLCHLPLGRCRVSFFFILRPLSTFFQDNL